MQEASFYEKYDRQVVKCFLCPHYCTLEDGERGRCKARAQGYDARNVC